MALQGISTQFLYFFRFFFLFVINSVDFYRLQRYIYIMRRHFHTLVERRPKVCPLIRTSFVFSSPFFVACSPTHSCRLCRVYSTIMIMFYSGCRCNEALSVGSENLVDNGRLFLAGSKNTRDRVVNLPDSFFEFFSLAINHCYSGIYVSYSMIYDFVRALPAVDGVMKNEKNFSVTHYFRKRLIRKMFYEYRNSIDTIIDFFGWKSRTSILYYI